MRPPNLGLPEAMREPQRFDLFAYASPNTEVCEYEYILRDPRFHPPETPRPHRAAKPCGVVIFPSV